MSVAVCILARNEEKAIGRILAQIAGQDIVTNRARQIEVHVVANGCTDHTAAEARKAQPQFSSLGLGLHVHDLHPGGKSRAWNRAVHDLTASTAATMVFIDADIEFVDEQVLTKLIAALDSDPLAEVCSGFPVKDVIAKRKKSLVDRFSLAVSSKTRHVGALNGSLYAARARVLREIWLPNETPGEDGFLNAMITTRGFSRPLESGRVIAAPEPTHFFEAHNPWQFMHHERRMIVGTVVNRWVFEYLWSLKLQTPAGKLIEEWNAANPDWVEQVIRRCSGSRRWLIPSAITLGRFKSNGARSGWRNVVHLPIALAATALTLPPAIMANRRLKAMGAAGDW